MNSGVVAAPTGEIPWIYLNSLVLINPINPKKILVASPLSRTKENDFSQNFI
jgi:hypothetical protein